MSAATDLYGLPRSSKKYLCVRNFRIELKTELNWRCVLNLKVTEKCMYTCRLRVALQTISHCRRIAEWVSPSAWNSLPDPVRNPNATESAFRRLWKTILFARYYRTERMLEGEFRRCAVQIDTDVDTEWKCGNRKILTSGLFADREFPVVHCSAQAYVYDIPLLQHSCLQHGGGDYWCRCHPHIVMTMMS